jgi:hypothetical protein
VYEVVVADEGEFLGSSWADFLEINGSLSAFCVALSSGPNGAARTRI